MHDFILYGLKVPENITFVFLPPYSHELHPAEQIWNMLRRNYFANKVLTEVQKGVNIIIHPSLRSFPILIRDRSLRSRMTTTGVNQLFI